MIGIDRGRVSPLLLAAMLVGSALGLLVPKPAFASTAFLLEMARRTTTRPAARGTDTMCTRLRSI